MARNIVNLSYCQDNKKEMLLIIISACQTIWLPKKAGLFTEKNVDKVYGSKYKFFCIHCNFGIFGHHYHHSFL